MLLLTAQDSLQAGAGSRLLLSFPQRYSITTFLRFDISGVSHIDEQSRDIIDSCALASEVDLRCLFELWLRLRHKAED